MAQKDPESSLAAKNFRPTLRLDSMLRPIHSFMEIEASGGIVLLIATIAALFLANTSLSSWYAEFWEQKLTLNVGGAIFEMSFLHLINEGLMTFFFFIVGLEIKREIVLGELRSAKKALLPILAAVGGMIVPALVYFMIEGRGPGTHGWAVPMATDIAFVVGFLSLLGKRVPHNLKIVLLTLAIADDIGAILVIATVYSKGIHYEYLLASLGFYAFVFVLNVVGVRRFLPYLLLGAGMWSCLLLSGIHPTLAGVLLGLAAPATKLIKTDALRRYLTRFQERLEEAGDELDRSSLRAVGREANSPLERLEVDLHPWVAFVIMPLFAFANAGVPVQLSALESGTAWAVILGLVVGKPIGIFCITWVAQAFRWVNLPTGVTAPMFFAGSCLAGIGFTMSIFIAGLALGGDLLVAAKVGTLLGSATSACLGLILLHRFLDRREIESSGVE